MCHNSLYTVRSLKMINVGPPLGLINIRKKIRIWIQNAAQVKGKAMILYKIWKGEVESEWDSG